MSLDLYDSTIEIPQTYEVVDAAHTILTGSANIVATYWIDSASHIYKHVFEGDNRPERHLVVREVARYGQFMSMDKYMRVRIQVMASINRLPEYTDKHKWLSAIHRRIHNELVGQTPALSLSTAVLPFEVSSPPSVPMYAPTPEEEYYSTAEFILTVRPND